MRELAPAALGFTPQPMVRWLGPRGLSATAMQVLLSTIFGAYSDKREIQAALKEPSESDFSDHDELWFDFLADTGDGFNPTFTTATLVARDQLVLVDGGEEVATPRGPLLVLGGDLAYPAATPTQFNQRFLGPMTLAFPESAAGDDPPTMIACAGNHDWYDGLTTFLRLFCDGRRIAGWRTEQTRSYFAIELPHRWWILGIDLAFDFFIDTPQMDFFRKLAAERIQPGDRVILVTHRPSWLFTGMGEKKLYTHGSTVNLQKFEREILQDNGIEVPLVLAGDIHHYNRYVSADGDQQRITAGAGGTFLHPTNHLRTEFEWPAASGPTTFRQEQIYPDAARSQAAAVGHVAGAVQEPELHGVRRRLLRGVHARRALRGARRRHPRARHSRCKESDPGLAAGDLQQPHQLRAGRGPARHLHRVRRCQTHGDPGPRGNAALALPARPARRRDLGCRPGRHRPARPQLGVELLFLEFTLTFDTLVLFVGVAVLGGYLASQLFAIYLFVMFTLFDRHATHAFSASASRTTAASCGSTSTRTAR